MKMQLKWWNWPVVLAVAVVLLVLSAAPGAATPSSGVTNMTLARGTDVSGGTIPLEEGTDVVVSQISIQPGGSSGWHMQPFTSRKAASARRQPTPPGKLSSSGPAKCTTPSTAAQPYMLPSPLTRVSLRVARHGSTCLTRARAQASERSDLKRGVLSHSGTPRRTGWRSR